MSVSTLRESCLTGYDSNVYIYNDGWNAETFTAGQAYTITSVKLLLLRGENPGTVTVSIRATDEDGHPTGEDLCVGTTNGNTLPENEPWNGIITSGEWRKITFDTSYVLSSGVEYAIVVRALDAAGNYEWVIWRQDTTGTYSGGNAETSEDYGEEWDSDPEYDYLFETWGKILLGGPPRRLLLRRV